MAPTARPTHAGTRATTWSIVRPSDSWPGSAVEGGADASSAAQTVAAKTVEWPTRPLTLLTSAHPVAHAKPRWGRSTTPGAARRGVTTFLRIVITLQLPRQAGITIMSQTHVCEPRDRALRVPPYCSATLSPVHIAAPIDFSALQRKPVVAEGSAREDCVGIFRPPSKPSIKPMVANANIEDRSEENTSELQS